MTHAPVISIGNIAMGGRGKTPLVAHVARLLIEAGERPAILSRGYGRRTIADGVVVVSDGRRMIADVDRGGDEPVMLARAVPGAAVFVGESRSTSRALAERVFGATVHLLDDGFQHAIRRDADIVVIAPEDLRGRRVPFGRLRESPAALARADLVIVDGAGPAAGARASHRLVRSLGPAQPIEPHWPAPDRATPVLAVAGIARPDRFRTSLESAGWTVADCLGFGDHHRYSRGDVERMATTCRERGAAAVLTTDKDATRLRPLRPLPVPMHAVPLVATVEPHDSFRAWLFDRIAAARARA